ncbi:hypothetical protein [Thalassobacillus hwangdonensis]|uniref:Uncharacterized protein n=1 Tax=Thalassobacillus hwangdonensis TaxID=546108 RepID=A0ABW3L4B4_9BACI
MDEQEFIDVVINQDESMAGFLEALIDQKREETGSYNIQIHQVVPLGNDRFTVILHKKVSEF